jgi:cobalt-precorrin-5B (C1)-methyltransferase
MKKKLRSGFTTGTAAAAAVKGALHLLARGIAPVQVRIPFLSQGHVDIPLKRCEKISQDQALCTVIKDGGDDPDVTHNAEIGAIVTLDRTLENVRIRGGKGVGRVTKPGLGLPVDGPAINPGPCTMIRMAVEDVLGKDAKGIDIEVFVEDGEHIAERTLNARLGILGGISILGTTGVVRPMSHDAYIATIGSSLAVAAAAGLEQVVFTTGRRSERYAMKRFPQLPDEAFVQVGDFFKASLEKAVETGIKSVTLAVFFGKAVKMAQGAPHTHAAKSDVSLETLAGWTLEISGDSELFNHVKTANTARHAFDMVYPLWPGVVDKVGKTMKTWAEFFSNGKIKIRSMIFDFEGTVIFDSDVGKEVMS